MGERVERQTAHFGRSRITEQIGHPAMGDFMKNNGDQNGERPDGDLLNRVLQNCSGKVLLNHEYGKAYGNTRREKKVVVQFHFNESSM